ncbi:MAG: hypothetical protein ABEI53_03140, partial [Candidatus Magasanikbacteria bacterium]
MFFKKEKSKKVKKFLELFYYFLLFAIFIFPLRARAGFWEVFSDPSEWLAYIIEGISFVVAY